MDSTPNTRLTRLDELASTDRHALDRLLDASKVAHVAVVRDERPVVIPTACARDGDTLLMHGSTGSGWMREVATGAPVSVAVTSIEGLVVARSAFESSMLYRSAVLFGSCTSLGGDDKLRALDIMTDHLIPGRSSEVRASTAKELAATLVLALPIEHWSLKVSDDWPEDPPEDVEGPAWAGLLPLRTAYDVPVPAPDLRDGIGVPASVERLSGQVQTPRPPA